MRWSFSAAWLQNTYLECLCYWSRINDNILCTELSDYFPYFTLSWYFFLDFLTLLSTLSCLCMSSIQREDSQLTLSAVHHNVQQKLHLTTIFGEQETLWFVRLTASLILRAFLNHFLWQTAEVKLLHERADRKTCFLS